MLVRWTEPALGDMENIRDYIAQDSPENANRFIEQLFDAAAELYGLPHRGRQVPESDRDDVRELIHKEYRIIYRVKPHEVDVLAVVHGSRDLNRLPNPPWIKS